MLFESANCRVAILQMAVRSPRRALKRAMCCMKNQDLATELPSCLCGAAPRQDVSTPSGWQEHVHPYAVSHYGGAAIGRHYTCMKQKFGIRMPMVATCLPLFSFTYVLPYYTTSVATALFTPTKIASTVPLATCSLYENLIAYRMREHRDATTYSSNAPLGNRASYS